MASSQDTHEQSEEIPEVIPEVDPSDGDSHGAIPEMPAYGRRGPSWVGAGILALITGALGAAVGVIIERDPVATARATDLGEVLRAESEKLRSETTTALAEYTGRITALEDQQSSINETLAGLQSQPLVSAQLQAMNARVAELETRVEAFASQSATVTVPAMDDTRLTAVTGDIATLMTRMTALEDQLRQAEAAFATVHEPADGAASVDRVPSVDFAEPRPGAVDTLPPGPAARAALSSLIATADTGAPFDGALQALEDVWPQPLPGQDLYGALQAASLTGAATPAQLLAQLQAVRPRVLQAQDAGSEKTDLLSRFSRSVSGLVSVQSADGPVTVSDRLLNTESALRSGALARAHDELMALPDPERALLSDLLTALETRLHVNQGLATLQGAMR